MKTFLARETKVGSFMDDSQYAEYINKRDDKKMTKHPFLKFVDNYYNWMVCGELHPTDYIVEVGVR